MIKDTRHTISFRRVFTWIAYVLLCVIISIAITFIPSGKVEADELSDVRSELSDKTSEMESLVEAINKSQEELNVIQGELDTISDTILVTQEEESELQRDLSAYMRASYRNGSVNLLDLILDAQNFNQLLDNLRYYETIINYYDDMVSKQKELKAELEDSYSQAAEKKNIQEETISEMNSQQEELSSMIDELTAREDELEAEQIAALAAAEETRSVGTAFDSGDTTGWQTGVASAYGGSTDAYTPNPGTTATGALCDDWSMGVAVPMAWPNYRSYFGRSVEISYGGKSVIATVNDCGGMGNGSRSLDLQPGVFKAFGFNSCNDWGLRTVSYRFL